VAFNLGDVARWGRRLAVERALRLRPSGAGSDLAALEARREPVDWWLRVDEDLSGVPHALIGAAASNAYMAPRMTSDLDVAVKAADWSRAEQLLAGAGYRRFGELTMSLDPRLMGSRWRTPSGDHVDLVAINHRWAGDAIDAAAENRLQGMPTLPLPYLVLMKLISSRAIDTADLQRLLGAASDEQWQAVRELVADELPRDLEDLDALRQIGLWERSG